MRAAAVVSLAIATAGVPAATPATPMPTTCAGPFLAKAPGELPPPGAGRSLADVELPAGGRGPNGDYWMTHEPVDDPRQLWGDLARRFDDTGLWPLITLLPSELWFDPFEVSNPDEFSAESLLSRSWTDVTLYDDVVVSTFGESFPGLAPHQSTCVHPIVDSIEDVGWEASYLLLVPVTRPADVFDALDVWISYDFDPGEVTAILRSWEERFGTYPMWISRDAFAVGIERPPKPGRHTERFWGEMIAFNPSMAGDAWDPPFIIGEPVGSSVWFWWD